MVLNEILRGLKRGQKKEKIVLKHHQAVIPTQEHPRLVGDCLGVRLLIFTSNSNFKTTLNLPNFYFS